MGWNVCSSPWNGKLVGLKWRVLSLQSRLDTADGMHSKMRLIHPTDFKSKIFDWFLCLKIMTQNCDEGNDAK